MAAEKPNRPVGRLIFCLLLGAFFAIYPTYVIRPFRAQGARELAVALAVARWSPWVTLLCALAAVWFAVRLWGVQGGPAAKTFKRLALLVAMVLCGAFAAIARVNIYELMFHPDLAPTFTSIAQAGVEDSDMVMAVRLGSEARAYPIREMGYHHVVNDVVGGEPIAATY